MSFKRKLEFQFNSLKNSFYSFRLPKWMTGKAMRAGLSLCIMVFTVGYIFQVSSTAVSGYQINDLENKIEDLNREIQKLKVETADHSTMKNIQARANNLGMVAVANVEYYKPTDLAVAVTK